MGFDNKQTFDNLRDQCGRISTELQTIKNLHVKCNREAIVSIGMIPGRPKNTVKIHDTDRFKKFATGDETWLHFDNEQNAQWKSRGESQPERYKKLIGAPKVMLAVFFSCERIFTAHQLPQRSNINAEIFINEVLVLLETKVNAMYHISTKDFAINFSYELSQNASIRKTFIDNSIFNRPQHPPFSSDISSCDYYLFWVLKSQLKGMLFTSVDEAHATAINILESIP
ncbi:MAG: hypothetical protein EZS28_029462 [Streblomastix strix]|uniref:Uncharacterized protein n=1 Tax=Streblomastix strix TaxID=222440 RepID=A0A5J4UYQ1_9EUKA|nr:MAG: hypothetical protein EZS28_029462 [Streblomastix strix]